MLAHKENPQRTLFPRDSKAMTMNVGICFGVRNNPPANLLHGECTGHPVIHQYPVPAST